MRTDPMPPHYVRPDHYPLPTGFRSDGVGHDGTLHTRPARKSTAPPGLWAPAPEVVAEKAVKVRKAVTQPGNVARQRPCGTEAAAKRHQRNGEPLCAVCVAGREARRTTTHKPKALPAKPGERCGQRSGYEDHTRAGEQACQPCKDAMAADARRRYALRGAALKPPTRHPQCGQYAGRAVHRRRGEKVCNACRVARNEADRKRHNGEERKAA